VFADILFALFLSTSIAIFGCLLFEALTQLFFSDGKPRWQIALGGAYSLVFTGAMALIWAALGGSIQ
jgi:hypothetical protein